MKRLLFLLPLPLLLAAAPTAPTRRDFDHIAHAAKAKKLDPTRCAACHTLAADFSPLAPGADAHKPCLSSGCHAKDFLKKDSPLCLSCHSSSDNFRKNPADQVWKGPPQHYAEISHRAHMTRPPAAGAEPVRCQSCHTVDATTFVAVEHPAHAQCATCHGKSTKAPMSQCALCHAEGDPAAYFDKTRKDAKLKDFSHEHVGHRFWDKDAKQKPIQCEACHLVAGKSDTLRALRGLPLVDSATMNAACAKCHDVRSTTKCNVCHSSVQTEINYHNL